MPAWFWGSPSGTAVGYSPPYQESPHAWSEAFEDAALRLFIDRDCRVHGEYGAASAPEGLMDMGNTFTLDYDSSGFGTFKLELARLDSFAAPEMMVMLVGRWEMEIDRRVISTPLRDFLTVVNPNEGTGSAPGYYHLSSTWQEAERDARINLAVNAAHHLRALQTRVNDEQFQVSVTKVDVRLWHVFTFYRGWDEVGQTATVMVRRLDN